MQHIMLILRHFVLWQLYATNVELVLLGEFIGIFAKGTKTFFPQNTEYVFKEATSAKYQRGS